MSCSISKYNNNSIAGDNVSNLQNYSNDYSGYAPLDLAFATSAQMDEFRTKMSWASPNQPIVSVGGADDIENSIEDVANNVFSEQAPLAANVVDDNSVSRRELINDRSRDRNTVPSNSDDFDWAKLLKIALIIIFIGLIIYLLYKMLSKDKNKRQIKTQTIETSTYRSGPTYNRGVPANYSPSYGSQTTYGQYF